MFSPFSSLPRSGIREHRKFLNYELRPASKIHQTKFWSTETNSYPSMVCWATSVGSNWRQMDTLAKYDLVGDYNSRLSTFLINCSNCGTESERMTWGLQLKEEWEHQPRSNLLCALRPKWKLNEVKAADEVIVWRWGFDGLTWMATEAIQLGRNGGCEQVCDRWELNEVCVLITLNNCLMKLNF